MRTLLLHDIDTLLKQKNESLYVLLNMDLTGKILRSFLKQFPLTSSIGDKFYFCIVIQNCNSNGIFVLADSK